MKTNKLTSIAVFYPNLLGPQVRAQIVFQRAHSMHTYYQPNLVHVACLAHIARLHNLRVSPHYDGYSIHLPL